MSKKFMKDFNGDQVFCLEYDKEKENEKQALLNELARLRLEKEKQNKDTQ